MNHRQKKKKLQQRRHKDIYRDTWNLDTSIAKFIVPRLEMFIRVQDCYPGNFDDGEEWDCILNKMLSAFKIIAKGRTPLFFTEDEKQIVNEGLDLFRKYYFQLWW